MGNLFVVLGPTGVGKTDISIEIAQRLSCSIISSDSRQIYKEMSIGTAKPSEEELQKLNITLYQHKVLRNIIVPDNMN